MIKRFLNIHLSSPYVIVKLVVLAILLGILLIVFLTGFSLHSTATIWESNEQMNSKKNFSSRVGDIPAIDAAIPESIQTATFALG